MKIPINFDEDEVNAIMFWFMTYEKKKKKISKIDTSTVKKILRYSKIAQYQSQHERNRSWRDYSKRDGRWQDEDED